MIKVNNLWKKILYLALSIAIVIFYATFAESPVATLNGSALHLGWNSYCRWPFEEIDNRLFITLFFFLLTIYSRANSLLTTIMIIALFGSDQILFYCLNLILVSLLLYQIPRFGVLAIPIPLLIFFVTFVPTPFFPDYPNTARVVADDGLSGQVRPTLGPELPLPVIERAVLKSSLRSLAALCFLFSLLSMRAVPIVLSAVVVLDTILPESLAVIAPLASLSRIIPGLFLLPITTIALAMTVIFLIVSARKIHLLALAASLFAYGYVNDKISGFALPKRVAALSSLKDSPIQDLISSPSAAVVAYYHEATGVTASEFKALRDLSRQPSFPISRLKPKISSKPDHDTTSLFDRRPKSRWSSGGGHQLGEEQILIELDQPIEWRSLELETGEFHSDYPRGLRIVFFGDHGETIYSAQFNEWLGSLRFTEHGFAYLSGQDQVEIYLPRPVFSKRLIIQQIGKSQSFDWSVSEIRFRAGPQALTKGAPISLFSPRDIFL